MRTIAEPPPAAPAIITRELCQRLSRAAVMVDRVLSGPPVMQAHDVDYRQRQREIERDARRELRSLRDVLDALPLD
jgi:hypothetical protein